MKNLHTFLAPEGKLDHTHRKMIEVQIENDLEYWKLEDIIFAANFPFEYKGVKAIEIPSSLMNKQFPANPRAMINSKVNIIIYLLENKLINELTWYHDFDAFQLAPLDVKLDKDMGVVCYGFYPPQMFHYWGKSDGPLGKDFKLTPQGYPQRINFGNVFFKPESLDIFKTLLEKMDSENLYEEDAMTLLLENPEIEKRVQIMNQTYNIGIRYIKSNIEIADKPLKVAHFPPNKPRWFRRFKPLLPRKLRKALEKRFDDRYILITGCKGLIGSYMLALLKEQNHNVVGIDVEIRDKEALRPYFKNAEFVIHCAAELNKDNREIPDEVFHTVNFIGTKNVSELCLEYGCKLINFGSNETKRAYGKSKQEAQKFVEGCGVKAMTFRLPPIYSKEMYRRRGKFFYPLERLGDEIVEAIRFNDFNIYKLDDKSINLHQS